MFCMNCGTQNGDVNAFCVNCGKPMQNNPPVISVQAIKSSVKKPNYTLIGILSAAAVVVIIVVILVLSLGGGSPLVGTWEIDPGEGMEQTATFTKDGMIIVESENYKDTAKYTTKGSTITITLEDGTETTGEFTITKAAGRTVLTLSADGEDPVIFYKK